MTPFVTAVVRYLGSHGGSADACALRNHLLDAGFGKHPAAVAMNLTKLAYKRELVTGYVDNSDCRVFVLTSDGQEAYEKL